MRALGRAAAASGGRSAAMAGAAANAWRKLRRFMGIPPASMLGTVDSSAMRFAFAATAVLTLMTGSPSSAQSLEAGRKTFEERCATCHGGDGEGGERGPAIGMRLPALGDPDLTSLIRDGRPLRGMPGNVMTDPARTGLIQFLRTLEQEAPKVVRTTLQTTDGRTLEGQVLGQGMGDLQLRTADERVHLLRPKFAHLRSPNLAKLPPSVSGTLGCGNAEFYHCGQRKCLFRSDAE